MTDGPGAASGDRAAADSREPRSGTAGPRPGPAAGGPAGTPAGYDPERSGAAAPTAGPAAAAERSQPPAPGGEAPAAGPSGAPGDVAGGEILADLAGLAAERDEYLGALQRLQADFENYRKRVARQQQEQSLRAAADLVGKVLPVLDTLDLARAHLGGADDAAASDEARALDQARGQLLDVLVKEGLERVDDAGVAFDPVVHDAVAASARADGPAETVAVEATDPAGAGEGGPAATGPGGALAGAAGEAAEDGGVTVDEVLRAGYRWRGQVLRPAMVRVRG